MSFLSNFAIRMRRHSRRIRRSEDGSVTIEFVLWFPLFMTLFLSSIEAGVMLAKNVMLERGLNVAVREVRLGNMGVTANDATILKQKICREAMLIGDCMNMVKIEMRPVDTTTWNPLGGNSICANRSLPAGSAPIVDSTLRGSENELVLIRACAIVDPFFPSSAFVMRMPKDPQDGRGYRLIASSAFVNEPG